MKNIIILSLVLILSTFGIGQNDNVAKFDSILNKEIEYVKQCVMISYLYRNVEIESVKDWIVKDESSSNIFQSSVFPPILFNRLEEFVIENSNKDESEYFCHETKDLKKCNLINKAIYFSQSKEVDDIIHQSRYLEVAISEIKKRIK